MRRCPYFLHIMHMNVAFYITRPFEEISKIHSRNQKPSAAVILLSYTDSQSVPKRGTPSCLLKIDITFSF